MFLNKISTTGTIDVSGKFTLPDKIFYVFLCPKGEGTENVAIMNAQPVYNDRETLSPLVVGAWNPVLFKSINPSEEQIQKYTIFWGTEDYK